MTSLLLVSLLLIGPRPTEAVYFRTGSAAVRSSIELVKVTIGSQVEIIHHLMPDAGEARWWRILSCKNPKRVLVSKTAAQPNRSLNEIYEINTEEAKSEPRLLLKTRASVVSADFLGSSEALYLADQNELISIYDCSKAKPSLVSTSKPPAGFFFGGSSELVGDFLFTTWKSKQTSLYPWYQQSYAVADFTERTNVKFSKFGAILNPNAPSAAPYWASYSGYSYCFPGYRITKVPIVDYRTVQNGVAFHWDGASMVRSELSESGGVTITYLSSSLNRDTSLSLVGSADGFLVGLRRSSDRLTAYLFDTTDRQKLSILDTHEISMQTK
jgi:hypothetical protein